MKTGRKAAAALAMLCCLAAGSASAAGPAGQQEPSDAASAPAEAAPPVVPVPTASGEAAPSAPPVPSAPAQPVASQAVAVTAAESVRAPAPVPVTSPEGVKTAEAVRIALVLTFLSLIPALLICMTPFVRIIVVLSMIRHAFGMPETPPNQVLVSLALFLTAFTMMPAAASIHAEAVKPLLDGRIAVEEAMDRGSEPLRAFMLRQVHDQDLKTVYEISKQPLPAKAADVGLMQLTSAFMLNELRVAFKIGFVILLPFLLIDLVVSSILLALGMLMVPPSTLSLPIKVLMFVLIDGWSLVLQGVVGSFR